MIGDKLQKLLLKPGVVAFAYVVAAVFAGLQLYSFGTHPFKFPTDPYPEDMMNHLDKMKRFLGLTLTEYNNYLIFKNSFFHLLSGENLYGLYPRLHWDYFKYSPTFALFMGALAYLPDAVGLCLWNALNAMAVFFAVRMLPVSRCSQIKILWFVALELLTCLQNTQSNGIMCGLLIAAFACMENGKYLLAALWISISVFVKVYGAAGFCLFLFYPGKVRFLAYSAFWLLLLAALPLSVTPAHSLVFQYLQWASLINEDARSSIGISVAGWLHSWFGLTNGKLVASIAGALLFLVPLMRTKAYHKPEFRLLMLAFMLVWLIIFNHKAESSTYVIAVAGVGAWYFTMGQGRGRLAVLLFVLVFTSMSTTDLFPAFVKKHIIYPYDVKVFPCIVACCYILFDLLTMKMPVAEPVPVLNAGNG